MCHNSKLRSEMLFGDASPGAILCVYVGRISKEKRLDVIVEAVTNIPSAYLAIIGDGPSAPFYAAMHGKENRIYCKPGFLTHAELAKMYASADVHVSASQFETLGNTVLEAFACGIPVVVPRCQGFCDTVADKLDGYLFIPGSSSSAQEYIELLQRDPVRRSAMGEHGRQVVSSHTVSSVVKDLVAWYGKGITRKREATLFSRFCAFCALLVMVPVAILSTWCYERLVSRGGENVYVFCVLFKEILLTVQTNFAGSTHACFVHHFILSSFCPSLFSPISFPVVSYPIISDPIPSCPIARYPSLRHPISTRPTRSCRTLSSTLLYCPFTALYLRSTAPVLY